MVYYLLQEEAKAPPRGETQSSARETGGVHSNLTRDFEIENGTPAPPPLIFLRCIACLGLTTDYSFRLLFYNIVYFTV